MVSKFGNEDLVQDAFADWLAAAEKGSIEFLDKPGAVYNFIRKAIKDRMANRYNRFDPFTRANTVKNFEQVEDTTPEYLLLKKQEISLFDDVVKNLTPARKKQTEAFLETGSIRDAANLLGGNYNTIKVNLNSVKDLMRQAFKESPIDTITNCRVMELVSINDESIPTLTSRQFLPAGYVEKRKLAHRIQNAKKRAVKRVDVVDLASFDKAIIEGRVSGATYGELAEKLNIPFKYVKAVCNKNKLASPEKLRRINEYAEQAEVLALYNKGLSVSDIMKKTGYKKYLVYDCIPQLLKGKKNETQTT